MAYGGYKPNAGSDNSVLYDGENIFENLGHAAEYAAASTVPDGQTDYTGSNYGAAAVIVKTHGSAVLHLSAGGEIPAANLTAGVLYPFSLKKITAASSAVIYVLKAGRKIMHNKAV